MNGIEPGDLSAWYGPALTRVRRVNAGESSDRNPFCLDKFPERFLRSSFKPMINKLVSFSAALLVFAALAFGQTKTAAANPAAN